MVDEKKWFHVYQNLNLLAGKESHPGEPQVMSVHKHILDK